MQTDPDTRAENQEGVKGGVSFSNETIEVIRGMLDQADHYLRSARHLLFEELYKDKARTLETHPIEDLPPTGSQRIIEGVFDGEQMVGHDGRRYPVPPNYASKSKLVSGDVLKLTIASDGTFIYKQIGPVERQKLMALLEEEAGRYYATVDGRRYQLLTASVTYYRAKTGDRVTVIVPRDIESEWAAVENLLEQSA